jgi:hypothetical protein
VKIICFDKLTKNEYKETFEWDYRQKDVEDIVKRIKDLSVKPKASP